MKALTICPLAPDDHEAFGFYIAKAYHEKYILRDRRYREWQYGESLLLAKHDGVVVGHFGFRDMRYKVYDRTLLVRVLMNLFVNPDYRLTGVGAILGREVFGEDHPVLVSGYTSLAEKLFSHLRPQWKNTGVLTRFFAVLNPAAPLFERYAIPQTTLSHTESGAITVDERVPSGPFIDACWRLAKDRFLVTVERTASYVTWRFIRHPFFSYLYLTARQKSSPAGYLVGRIEEDKGFRIARIIDLIATPAVEGALLGAFIERAKREGADGADMFFSGSVYREALHGAGFFDVAGTDFEKFPILFSPLSFKKASINIGYDMNAPLEDCFFTKADGDQDRPNPYQ
ncbi:MAG: hypothetical protein Q8Q94_03195 [bacterium]|nr:hypothetical protein [bacterium]MDZ4299606.1 hypothetical protein [Candidatus Sungbacteria bacterium]